MRVRLVAVLAFAACAVMTAGPAQAGEQVCIPFNGPTTLGLFDKEYIIPGHSLPCQDIG